MEKTEASDVLVTRKRRNEIGLQETLLALNGQQCLIIVQKAINPVVRNIVEFRK
jgi:hypothetical protein